jgi:hypothetical protein
MSAHGLQDVVLNGRKVKMGFLRKAKNLSGGFFQHDLR